MGSSAGSEEPEKINSAEVTAYEQKRVFNMVSSIMSSM